MVNQLTTRSPQTGTASYMYSKPIGRSSEKLRRKKWLPFCLATGEGCAWRRGRTVKTSMWFSQKELQAPHKHLYCHALVLRCNGMMKCASAIYCWGNARHNHTKQPPDHWPRSLRCFSSTLPTKHSRRGHLIFSLCLQTLRKTNFYCWTI